MMNLILALGLVGLAGAAGAPPTQPQARTDSRNLRNGWIIPDEGYCDQPYVVVTRDGNWLCTLTTGAGVEGQRGQHVVATISADRGKTWSKLIDIEPADGPEASWVMPLIVPGGRVYVFYDYNGDRVNTLKDKKNIRADMLGWFVCKFSDDHGRTWSVQRYRLPVRQTEMDRANDWAGQVQMLWGIGKPIVAGQSVYLGFSKIGRYVLDKSEGWFFRSDNILTEPDPAKIDWKLLPDGEIGLRSVAGPIAEEQNLVALSDGSLYAIYRTIEGHPCHAYSRDGGYTWTPTAYATYTPSQTPCGAGPAPPKASVRRVESSSSPAHSPGGAAVPPARLIKHPRACPKIWKTTNGKYLLWYHNNGGKNYDGRNPAWVAGGIEKDGFIHWSQPEILLYDPDPGTRISYPDLIEQDGRYWITETQKTVARVHEIEAKLLEQLWAQGTDRSISQDGLLLSLDAGQLKVRGVTAPRLPDLHDGGFTIDLWFKIADLSANQVILDARDRQGKGVALRTTDARSIQLELCDGTARPTWDCDPGALDQPSQNLCGAGPAPPKASVSPAHSPGGAGISPAKSDVPGTASKPDQLHHVVIIVDGGPKIIAFVVDGILCDGGTVRPYGWGRFGEALGNVNGSNRLLLAPSFKGEFNALRFYNRPLRTSEAVSHFLAGAEAK